MNFFNPFQQTRPPVQKIDPNKLKEYASNLSKDNLFQLVQQARAQGIPDAEIEAGLNFILSLK